MESNGILIDSSLWIAIFLDYDSNHLIATEIFEKIDAMIYVPYCVIAEVCTVLTYKHSRKQSDKFLAFIESNSQILQIDNFRVGEITFYKTLTEKISFIDASIIYIALSHGFDLITLDRQMSKIYSRIAKKAT